MEFHYKLSNIMTTLINMQAPLHRPVMVTQSPVHHPHKRADVEIDSRRNK